MSILNEFCPALKISLHLFMTNKLNPKEAETLRVIRRFLASMQRFPTIMELTSALNYKSSRSAFLLLNQLVQKGFIQRKQDGSHLLIDLGAVDQESMREETIEIPLVGDVACGVPILAEENIITKIPVSLKLARPPHKYFLLKAKGDSMNAAGINNGDIVLVRQQVTAENGDFVVALIDDEATVKEFRRNDNIITLIPRSKSGNYKPTILTRDFLVQGIVIATIPDLGSVNSVNQV
jgi:repressor LexA